MSYLDNRDVAMLILNHDLWWKVLCSARSENNSTPMRELIRNMPGTLSTQQQDAFLVYPTPTYTK